MPEQDPLEPHAIVHWTAINGYGERDLLEIVETMLLYIERHGISRKDDPAFELIHKSLIIWWETDWKVWVECNKCGKNFESVTYDVLKKHPGKVAAYLVGLYRMESSRDFYRCRACGGVDYEAIQTPN